jgi:K+-sensing histidine kinase KdpD
MKFCKRQFLGYAASIAGVTLIGLIYWPLYDKIRAGTATSLLLLLVLLIATTFGTGPAICTAVAGAICLNFFFVPPLFDVTFPVGWNLVALITLTVVAIVAGQLSSRLKRRATEIQRLYDQLRESFDQASKIEALKQSEQLKSALLDAVTHDLRTPLTSIKAAATALKNSQESGPSLSGLKPAAEKDFLNVIVDQSDRLNRFIEGMLELAKVQSGNFGERTSTNSAEEIITAAMARAENMLSGHQVTYYCEDDIVMSSINPKSIAQVIFSLLENATRYAPRGSDITITAEKAGGEVRIAVEDAGPGIPPQYHQQVFEKFFQVPAGPSGVTSIGAGLGLGLAIARGIVEAHGGRIWIEGRKGGMPGTAVVFTVKAAAATPEPVGQRP